MAIIEKLVYRSRASLSPINTLYAGLLWTCAALLLCFFPANCLNALPPESSLPGSGRSAEPNGTSGTSKGAGSKHSLPSESQLPSSVRSAPALKLPAEHALPRFVQKEPSPRPATPNQPGNAAVDELEKLLAASRDARIRLRLAVPEHTSNVLALAYDSTSTHLFTGGDDKVVHHWQLTQLPGRTSPQWLHEETLRWQVGSGQVGFVRALACINDVVCMAGYGTEGTRGEILRYDWKNRRWLEPWVNHTRPIVKLISLTNGSVISVDERLGIGLQTPDGAFQWLKKPDPDRASYWPVVAWNRGATAEWARSIKGDKVPWLIQSQIIGAPATVRTFSPLIPPGQELGVMKPLLDYRRQAFPRNDAARDARAMAQMVAPNVYLLAASADGRMLAAVDDADPQAFGMWLYVWRDGTLILKHRILANDDVYRHLAWSATGNELAVLAEVTDNKQRFSAIDLWRFNEAVPRMTRIARYTDQCFQVQFSPDSKWLAVGSRSSARVIQLVPELKGQRLPEQSAIVAVTDVSFANAGYAWKATIPGRSLTFDPVRMANSVPVQTQWQPQLLASQAWREGSWSIQSKPDGFHVLNAQSDVGAIDPCDTRVITPLNTVQWIKDERGVPEAIAVAYRIQRENEIHIFSLRDVKNGRLARLRIFTGHEGQVNSLSVSADQKYLISSGSDRMVCMWPLAGIHIADGELPEKIQKWGAVFTLQNGKLVIERLSSASPLFEFGLREGDEIHAVTWFSLANDGVTAVPNALQPGAEAMEYLHRDDFDTIVKFSYQRPGSELRHVQLKPHWRPLLSQTFSGQGEWAAWTAAGYYTSSFNGNTLFGWQVNRGVRTPPEFFRADRFQAILERPEVLKRILLTGSVDAAAKAVGERIGRNFHPLENAIALQPKVRILSPQASETIARTEQMLQAEVVLPRGSDIASLKAFANGVPAKLVSHEERATAAGEPTTGPDKVAYLATWRANLPSDTEIKLQVAVASSEKLVGTDEVVVRHTGGAGRRRRPKLWAFAAGVGHYADDRIAPLQTPEQNVEAFAGWLEQASRDLYDCQIPMVLTGPHMTRSNWLAIVNDKLSEVRQTVQPDDVVVIFLSGHGLQEPVTQDYYFVTANAKYSDVRTGILDQCLGIYEIAPFADLACRKIVLLDTCHSGALQPLESDRLKSAVRTLQADLVLTLTASAGDQAAIEVVGSRNSLFTEVLGRALTNPRDDNHDQILSWPEFVNQVREEVLEKSTALNMKQAPTVVPAELLPYVQLPLAAVHSGAE